MNLKTAGAFALTDSMTGAQLTAYVREVERLGYSSFWFPEAFGRDPFALAAHLLSVTEKIVVGTGIANIWKREPIAMIGAARTLTELYPDRFILGVGVSHGPMMAQLGIKYAKPVDYMRDYLARMKAAPYSAPRAKSDPPIVIAALMPKMLALAAAETHGTFPVYITPEKTAQMRQSLGADKWICVQQVALARTRYREGSQRRAQGARVLPDAAELSRELQDDGIWRRGFRKRRQRSPGRWPDRMGRRGYDSQTRRCSLRRWRDTCLHYRRAVGGRVAGADDPARYSRTRGARASSMSY